MTEKKKLTDEAAAENPAVAKTLAQHDDTLPGAPDAPARKSKRPETLHMAFLPDEEGFINAAVFGTELDAYKYAFAQDPKWDVRPIRKGQPLLDVV